MKDLNDNYPTYHALKQQLHNPHCTNNNGGPLNILRFTVNIPLETDEILVTNGDESDILNIVESSPLKIMQDKRKLLISQQTSNILPPLNINNSNIIPDHYQQVSTTMNCFNKNDTVKYNHLNTTMSDAIPYTHHSNPDYYTRFMNNDYVQINNDNKHNVCMYNRANVVTPITNSKSLQDKSSSYYIVSTDVTNDTSLGGDTVNIENSNSMVQHSNSTSPNTNNNNKFDNNDQNNSDNNDNFVEQLAKIYITDHPTPRNPEKTKPCNCQKTGCLKLYCECFARGDSCFNCSCKCCLNSPNDFEHWLKASNLVKSRRKCLLSMPLKNGSSNKIRRGCNCKRSLCLKKYCECFDKKMACTKYCRCIDCCNGVDNQQNTRHISSHITNNNSGHSKKSSIGYAPIIVTSNNNQDGYVDASQQNQHSINTYSSDSDLSKITPKYHRVSRFSSHLKNDTIPSHGGGRSPFRLNANNNIQERYESSHSRLHSSQSSNDLLSNPKQIELARYSKSNSTPNLLSSYSINMPGNHYSSGGVNSYITSDTDNNKQMMHLYLNLIAKNPGMKE